MVTDESSVSYSLCPLFVGKWMLYITFQNHDSNHYWLQYIFYQVNHHWTSQRNNLWGILRHLKYWKKHKKGENGLILNWCLHLMSLFQLFLKQYVVWHHWWNLFCNIKFTNFLSKFSSSIDWRHRLWNVYIENHIKASTVQVDNKDLNIVRRCIS